MNIPVFVSCPTVLNNEQNVSRRIILAELAKFGLEPRALGRSDYPTAFPLHEVYVLAQHCSGGVILGFEQHRATAGIFRRGTPDAKKFSAPLCFPTAWNHLEAGILFGLRLPLLVFKESGITGGVFDSGVTDVFVHKMPKKGLKRAEREALSAVFMKWQGDVRAHYYRQLPT
jgi:hypothetical protein